MRIRKVLAVLTGYIFLILGGIFGVQGAARIVCRIVGGTERVSSFFASKLPFEELQMIEFIGLLLGLILGGGLGIFLWLFLVWKTKWLTPKEIIESLTPKKKIK